MNRLFHFLLLTSVISACQSESTTGDSIPISDIDAFQSYSIDINGSKTKLTDQIASVEIARLEETSESLLSRIQHIFQHEDNLLLYNESNGDIFIFDEAGKFKRKINRSGNGPEEYERITDMWLEDDVIAIHTRVQSEIKKYTFLGELLQSLRLPGRVDHINSYKDGYVFGTNFIPFQDSIRYQWGIWNDKFELVNKYQPFNASDDNQVEVDYSLNTILPDQMNRFLLRVHSDTVYILKGNNLTPLIHFNFMDDWFWTNRGAPKRQDLIEVEGSDQVWQNDINIGGELIYLRSVVDYKGWENFIINRQNKKVIRLDIRRTSDELFTLSPLLWQEDRLLSSLPSSEVAEFINQTGTENVQFKQGTSLEIIESSENPVLLWIKFKKDLK